jgi:hypothetical protein
MQLKITAITEDRIICGAWEFNKITGAEIDDDFPSMIAGSFIKMPGIKYVQAEKK